MVVDYFYVFGGTVDPALSAAFRRSLLKTHRVTTVFGAQKGHRAAPEALQHTASSTQAEANAGPRI